MTSPARSLGHSDQLAGRRPGLSRASHLPDRHRANRKRNPIAYRVRSDSRDHPDRFTGTIAPTDTVPDTEPDSTSTDRTHRTDATRHAHFTAAIVPHPYLPSGAIGRTRHHTVGDR